MKHRVILRDDDLNATSSYDDWAKIMAPLRDAGFPIALSVIPEVDTESRLVSGTREGYLQGPERGLYSLREQPMLCERLRRDGHAILQHGLHHHPYRGQYEFRTQDQPELLFRFERGRAIFRSLGIEEDGFVAPQDQWSTPAFALALELYSLISLRNLNWRRVGMMRSPQYLFDKKVRGTSHFHFDNTSVLTHPGCLLDPSLGRPGDLVERAIKRVRDAKLTVLVVHHWQYTDSNDVLSQLASAITESKDIEVVDIRDARAWI